MFHSVLSKTKHNGFSGFTATLFGILLSICGTFYLLSPVHADTTTINVSTESEFIEAINNNPSGSSIIIKLIDNITYASNDGITVNDDIIIDFNGHKISTTNSKYLINEVAENASLTFQNAEMTDIHDSIIGDNYGQITFESTAGEGIKTTANYTWEPYITRGDGMQIAAIESDIIARNYGDITFVDGNYSSEGNSIIEYVYDDSKITINDGYYKAYYNIIYELEDSELTINNGEFISENNDAFDDIYNSKVTFYNGKITSYYGCFYIEDDDSSDVTILTIHDGIFESLEDSIITNYGDSDGHSEVNIYDGNFIAHEYYTLYNNGILNIYGGNFKFDSIDGSDYAAVYNYDDYNCTWNGYTNICNYYDSGRENSGVVNLLGPATFDTNGATSSAFKIEDGAEVNISPDYYAVPSDFLENRTPKLEIFKWSVEFIANGEIISTQYGDPHTMTFPENPVHPEGYEFKYWEDEEGNRIEDLTLLKSSCKLYAVFSDRIHTVTFVDGTTSISVEVITGARIGDLPNIDRAPDSSREEGTFWHWTYQGGIVNERTDTKIYENITIEAKYHHFVYTYDELLAAINDQEEVIILGDNIPVSNNVIIDYDTIISSYDKYSLIRTSNNYEYIVTISGDNTEVNLDNIMIDGDDIEASHPAVNVEKGATLNLDNTTIQNNNHNLYKYDIHGGGIYNEGTLNIYKGTLITNNSDRDEGGGIYNEGTVEIYDGAIIKSNSANHGGGIYTQCSEWNEEANIHIYGGEIVDNYAKFDGGGIHVDGDSSGRGCPSRLYMYDGRISHNTAEDGGGIYIFQDYGYLSDASFYMYGGEIVYNSARADIYSSDGGGGVNLFWGSMVMEGGLISHNIAEGRGGGIVAGDEPAHNNFLMKGGEISYNVAGVSGGGIGQQVSGEILGGKIYGNIAVEYGDDIEAVPDFEYNEPFIDAVKILDARPYSRGDYSDMDLNVDMLDAINRVAPNLEVDLLDGQPEPFGVLIPFKGYYVDGYFSDVFNRYRIANRNRYMEDGYIEKMSTDRDVFKWGMNEDGDTFVGLKTIYSGTVLLYKSNYNDDYQYDPNGYLKEDSATILDSMFTREGYYFVGWNTEPDGSGETLNPNDTLLMDHSKILYAQWKPLLRVTYKANFDSNETYNDENSYIQNDEAIILSNMFARKNYTFLGWNTEPDGSGKMFAADEILVMDTDKVLYAQWQYVPDVPETGVDTDDQSNAETSFGIVPIGGVVGLVVITMISYQLVSKSIRRSKVMRF